MASITNRYIGIDLGEKRVGIAISDPLFIIAQAYTTIKHTDNADTIKQIEFIIKDKNISKIIIGLPLTMKGTHSIQTNKVSDFIIDLKKKVSIPIIEIDERMSSIAAKDILVQKGIKTGHNKKLIDQMAATIILQEYLDSNK